MNKIDSVLGQRVTYPQTYSPEVLVAVPRQLNRTGLGIADEALPFVGFDAWHAYEVSCLTNGGLPTAGLMKIVVPCTSPSIVESKSLKLYLNSFNMEHMGATPTEATANMTERVKADLSKLLNAEVNVQHFGADSHKTPLGPEMSYETMEDGLGEISTSQYTECSDLLGDGEATKHLRVKSHLLRSNCRVTHQPDWGTIIVNMEGERTPKREDLLKYLISLRGENHFHEEICELAFTRLMERFAPNSLMVACLYTRRGGIDINPVRATSADHLIRSLSDVSTLTELPLRS